MNGEWCYFRQYLSKDFCENIINNALTIDPQQAVLGVHGNHLDVNLNYRRSLVRFIQKDDWRFKELFDVLWKTATLANNEYFSIHISRLDYVQFAEYDETYQGEYKSHHDVFWMNDDPLFHRKMSGVIQLSDPSTYIGCDLELIETSYLPPRDEIREQGSIVYFPSFFKHRATPIIRGKRYSIAAWFDGPRWK